jgi:hypothetical protein
MTSSPASFGKTVGARDANLVIQRSGRWSAKRLELSSSIQYGQSGPNSCLTVDL